MFDCRRPPQCAIGILGIFASALSGGPGHRSARLSWTSTTTTPSRWPNSSQSRCRRRLAGLKASLQRLAAAVQNASQPSIESDRRAYFNFGQFAVKFPSHEPYDRSSRVNGWFTLKLALKKTMLDLLRVGAHKVRFNFLLRFSISYFNFLIKEAVAMLALLQLRACEADTLLDLKLTAQLRCRYYGSTQRESPSWLWDVSITTGNLSRNKGETMPVYFNYYGNTESMPVLRPASYPVQHSFALTCFAKIYWPPVALSSCTRSLGVAPERGRFNFVTSIQASHLQTLTIVQQLWTNFNKAKRSKLKKTRPQLGPPTLVPNPFGASQTRPECTSAATSFGGQTSRKIQPPICRPVFGPPPTVSVLARIRNCTPPRSLPPCDAIRSVQLAPTWRARVPTPDPRPRSLSGARFLRVRRPGASGTSPRASNGPRIPGAREAGDEDERGGERLPAHHSRQDLELPTHGAPAPQRVDSLPPRAPHATRSTPSPRHERLSNAAQFWPRAPESASARALPPAPSARPPRSNGCGRVQAGAPAPVLNAAGLYSSAASGGSASAAGGARVDTSGQRGRRESSGTLARHRVAAADNGLAGRATQEAHRRTQEAHRRATAICDGGGALRSLGLGRRHAAARTCLGGRADDARARSLDWRSVLRSRWDADADDTSARFGLVSRACAVQSGAFSRLALWGGRYARAGTARVERYAGAGAARSRSIDGGAVFASGRRAGRAGCGGRCPEPRAAHRPAEGRAALRVRHGAPRLEARTAEAGAGRGRRRGRGMRGDGGEDMRGGGGEDMRRWCSESDSCSRASTGESC
ncbi:hypothetical protein B0H15DRAFT_1005901 [Mycena belliarum]|uniref:Uncharacterized protein n=1 Tax=Mycena belliarum TaxID=1033014 RepID=A0AAD6TV13_9AGAR|nr:hypothetical protein B0H15DRAFT_1005901 [Mycena belliae]